MKMFVWENVFCDYSCGMLAAFAESKEQALQVVKDKMTKEECMWNYDQIANNEPKVVEQPDCYWSYGGG